MSVASVDGGVGGVVVVGVVVVVAKLVRLWIAVGGIVEVSVV